jgi:hypothetical protein
MFSHAKENVQESELFGRPNIESHFQTRADRLGFSRAGQLLLAHLESLVTTFLLQAVTTKPGGHRRQGGIIFGRLANQIGPKIDRDVFGDIQYIKIKLQMRRGVSIDGNVRKKKQNGEQNSNLVHYPE